MDPKEEVTRLLGDLSAGNQEASNALWRLVFDQLHALASRYMRRERADHTLQATALVNEAYLKLVGGAEISWEGRAHFLRVAARAMRRILIDHARERRSAKKGGAWDRTPLTEAAVFMQESSGDLVDLDETLNRFAALDPQAAEIVELRFFAGLTAEETARVLGISVETVGRDWRMARAWLKRELEK